MAQARVGRPWRRRKPGAGRGLWKCLTQGAEHGHSPREWRPPPPTVDAVYREVDETASDSPLSKGGLAILDVVDWDPCRCVLSSLRRPPVLQQVLAGRGGEMSQMTSCSIGGHGEVAWQRYGTLVLIHAADTPSPEGLGSRACRGNPH